MATKHVALLWAVAIHLCGCCSPSGKLDKIIEEGLNQHRQEDLVRLQFDRSLGAGQRWPADNQEILQRPHLGDNVTFVCELPPGKNWHTVSWLHQDRVVFERGQRVPVEDGQQYTFSHLEIDNTMLFRINNVSLQASGTIGCVEAPDPSGFNGSTIPMKRYMLLPLVTRASEVFHSPMPNQVVTAGDTLTVECQLRLPLPPPVLNNNYLLNHIMIRHTGRLQRWPSEPPYSLIQPKPPLSPETIAAAVEITKVVNRGFRSPLLVKMDLPNMQVASGTGAVECWFRPHVGLHEWIVQKADITVQPRKL